RWGHAFADMSTISTRSGPWAGCWPGRPCAPRVCRCRPDACDDTPVRLDRDIALGIGAQSCGGKLARGRVRPIGEPPRLPVLRAQTARCHHTYLLRSWIA